jgi:tetratricopeptide (TPR) repeat protein
MKRWVSIPLYGIAAALLLAACAGMASGSGGASGEGLSLDEAVEQSAAAVSEKLPARTRVAIVAFEAEHQNLAAYIMDELTGALVNSSLEVADRNNLEYVFKELNFQMSGDVDDESAAAVGKFLGAVYVITGQLVNTGGAYRYRLNAITVEAAKHEVSERRTVRDDQATKSLVAALREGKPAARAASYGTASSTETGRAPPSTAGPLLDWGIIFASRGEYHIAIKDFTEAIALKPDLYSAYILRGQAWYASVSRVTTAGKNFSGVSAELNTSVTREKQAVYDRAIADFDQAVKLEPNSFKAYFERGNVYIQKGDNDRAFADYTQAIRLNPDYASAYVGRGITSYVKNDYDRAITEYTQAIRLDPNNTDAYSNRGNYFT